MPATHSEKDQRIAAGAEESDGSLWLLNIAILMLAGFAAGMVVARSDFHDSRVLYNGWGQLAAVAVLLLVLMWSAARFRGRLLLRLQVALLLSLLVHLGLVYYLHHQYMAILAHQQVERMRDLLEPPDLRRTLPDYQFDEAGEVLVADSLLNPSDVEVPDHADTAARQEEPSTENAQQYQSAADDKAEAAVPEPVISQAQLLDEKIDSPPAAIEVPRGAIAAPSIEADPIALPGLISATSSAPTVSDEPTTPEVAATVREPALLPDAMYDMQQPSAARARSAAQLSPLGPIDVVALDAAAERDLSQFDTAEQQLSNESQIPRAMAGATVPSATLRIDVPDAPLAGSSQPADVEVSTAANQRARGDLPDLAEMTTAAGESVVESGRPRRTLDAVQRPPSVPGETDRQAAFEVEASTTGDALRDRRQRVAAAVPLPKAEAPSIEAPRAATASNRQEPLEREVTQRQPAGNLEGLGPPGVEAAVTNKPAPSTISTPTAPKLSPNELASIDRAPASLEKRLNLPDIDAQVDLVPAPAFRQRQTDERDRNAAARGGSAGSERAVGLGLQFLARMQHSDGRWSLHTLKPGQNQADAATGAIQADTAATGLALLSYLGAGYTHRDGKYRETVRSGLNYLLSNQKANGDLFTGGAPYAWLYSHGIASIALCEAYGMTRDRALRDPAQRALAFIVSAQHPTLGGWRYVPGRETDTSVSGWQMMALKSGELAGLRVPRETYQRVNRWLETAASADGTATRYAYMPASNRTHQREPSRAMTAEALLMRLYLGWQKDDPRLALGAQFIEEQLPRYGTPADRARDAYYWYYATQVLFQMGGPVWETWNSSLRDLLVDSQVDEGPWTGSWHPTQPVPDRWGAQAGRLYVTAMHILLLEVYYRHLPLYQTLSN